MREPSDCTGFLHIRAVAFGMWPIEVSQLAGEGSNAPKDG
jgi:hypothetical protein